MRLIKRLFLPGECGIAVDGVEDVDEARVDRAEHGELGADELLVQVDVLLAPAHDGRVEAADARQVAVVGGEDAEAEVAPVAAGGGEVVVVVGAWWRPLFARFFDEVGGE